jgi:eukaryotic-like serine/threonine-protein kinase
LNRFFSKRYPVVLALLTALLIGVSGCGGAVRPTSWTGITLDDDVLYAADLQQTVALDAENADLLWAFPTDPKQENRGLFYVTPAVTDQLVIVASQVAGSGFLSQASQIVWGLDRENGALLWQFNGAKGQYVEGGAVGGDVFVIGNSDGKVYALHLNSGALKWSFETEHRVWSTPLIVSDTVYIGSMDHHLYALNLDNGALRWDFKAGGAFAGAPAMYDGVLYVGAFDDYLYAIDAETGEQQWRYSTENWIWGGPVIHEDIVYATGVSGNVYAVATDTGAIIWQKQLDAPVRAGPATSEDGDQLFVGAENGVLYALDTADGMTMWSREAEGQVLSRPLARDGVVYEPIVFGSLRLRAMHAENGRDIWTYPPPEEK